MRTLFLDYFAQSLVLGLAVLALLAAAPFLQKRYSARWFCRAWLALAVLLALPLRAVLPEAAPATVTLTPPPALLAVEEHGEAPVSQAAVPGPDMDHSAVSEVSSGQTAAPDTGVEAASPGLTLSLSQVAAATADIGLPQLAMHSPYETAGVRDTEYLIRMLQVYFS